MNKRASLKGALAGLAGNYGSDESSDGESSDLEQTRSVHQPIWSVCVDATTGCPYYWEQITNKVSWEPPPGFVDSTPTPFINSGKITATPVNIPPIRTIQAPKIDVQPKSALKKHQTPLPKYSRKPKSPPSDDDEERIELITSFHNSDSGSGDENESKNSKFLENNQLISSKKDIKQIKKEPKIVTHTPFGPELPANLSNELSKNILKNVNEIVDVKIKEKSNGNVDEIKDNLSDNGSKASNEVQINDDNMNKKNNSELESDNLDELIVTQATLLKQLGELNSTEVNYLNGSSRNSSNVNSRTHSPIGSPNVAVNSPTPSRKSTLDMDVDDLIAQIEKEQPMDKTKISDSTRIEIDNSATVTSDGSETERDGTFKPLFPSCAKLSIEPIEGDGSSMKTIEIESETNTESDKKVVNKYETILTDEIVETNALKRKRRIALDILPGKSSSFSSKRDVSYTYSTGERMGLGFKKDSDQSEGSFNESVSKYSNFSKGVPIVFQKGEVLNLDNNEKSDGALLKDGDDKFENMNEQKTLIESKLKFLVQNLPAVPPVQQLYIEFQTLWGALTSGALQNKHMYEWLHTANSTLDRLEASAAPHPWICRFHSVAGCYVYEHPDTGQWQWEYPGQDAPPPPPSTPPPVKPPAPLSPPPDEPSDMDISTTPPPPQLHHDRLHYVRENIEPLPPGVETPTNNSPMPLEESIPSATSYQKTDAKDSLCSELDNFYSDIAALDESLPATETNSRESFLDDSPKPASSPIPQDSSVIKDKDKKKKLKGKPLGMKNKSVSKLVEKWKKVQETLDD